MSTLLVQSCSKSKKETSKPISALELYSGYFFKIIKKSIREGTENANVDICILSAKYGLIDPDDEIPTYDQRMDQERAQEMGGRVRDELQRRVEEEGYTDVIINMGKAYQQALDGFHDGTSANVHVIQGDGIGTKGRALKRFLRGDESGLERAH